ncbi:phage tail tape measure protein [Rhodococcus sp. AH-ZY2]|uniref:phage tail tape measure protein n=1 Tax=Rhodococcus sp. AH-ZY2 TaxID=3047468 RepID=UPI0027E1BE6C|nr:phage tail tape measure protein [Rhodococcus sp. AH-ZY2]WML63663.1 phage tail tape measure protein [Rhodococcus sp. AH-ZY2]
MAGGRIDIEVAPDLRNFPAQMETGLRGAVGAATKIGSALGVALGAGAAAKAVLDIGNSFTTELNTLQAVSGATADQLQRVRDAAMGLGNDATLADTSATDAAAAMTELAKGGFSVEQSMAAARGTLELAAAAQIGAAEAATIQSQALQAFGLDADYAGRAADVLANGANASSAEITDIAMGLQQAGTVANGFGISMEDTVTTLAMFANAGITGSDAGTLMKSSLLALTDQGKPAQKAIEELGLTVYDQNKQFVGMRSLFEQLATASQNMSQEQFQAATNTLFGSDAIRQAMVAAQQGAPGFDRVAEAIGRQGSAAEVAAAKTQGLPGAMSAVQNSAEGLAIAIYDVVDGPLESLISKGADFITDFTPAVVSGLSAAGSAVGTAVGAFTDLPPVVQAATVALVALRTTGLGAALGGAATTAVSALRAYGTAAVGVATATNRIVTVAGMGAVQMGRFGSVVGQLGTHVPVVARMQGAFMNAAAGATTFGRTAGVAAAASTGLRSAAGGVVSMLGGPWVVGIAAAAAAVYTLVQSLGAVNDFQDAVQSSARDLSAAQRDVGKAFQESQGSINDTVLSAQKVAVDEFMQGLTEVADATPSMMDEIWTAILNPPRNGANAAVDEAQRIGEAAERAAESLKELNITNEELTASIAGSPAEFAELEASLRNTGNGGEDAIAKIREMREEFLEAQRSAKTLEPGFLDLADATRTLADASASADDKASALKRTLDVLAGVPVPLSDAIAAYNERVRETADETTAAWDATAGFGAALINADGSVNTASANGGRLYDTLKDIRDATADAAAAGADMGPIWAQNEQQFQQLATAAGLSVDQIRAAAEQLGLNPEIILAQVKIEGADQALQELNNVALAFQNSNDLSVEVQVDDAAAKANLQQLGFTIEQVPGTKNVQITAPNQLALTALQEVINKTVEAGAQSATPTINADTTGFVVKNEQVLADLRNIDTTQVDPAVGAVINDFLAGRDVTLAELAKIDATKANPQVLLAIQNALANAQVVSAEIDKAARDRQATIRVTAQWDPDARAAYFGSPTVAGPMPQQLPGRATGGKLPSSGPGTERTDGIYAVMPDGTPIAMVDGSEWVINSRSSDRYDRELAMINAGTFPKLPGFETGGRIAADRATTFLRGESGKEYQYGGVGNPSWDCSGFVSAAYALLKGLDPYTRWFTTESNFAALGFQPGLGGTPDLNIGVHNGGGGMYSHMAGTLDGTPFESGGNGVRWGAGAAGADDPQFENHYHLPAAAFNPPGGGAMRLERSITWSDSDELGLQSSQVSVTQAKEDRDRVYADPKKTEADRQQADLKVAKAEQKVKDLEAEKYAAETGGTGPAPQAPELTTSRSDDEIRMRELERSIAEANERRNEVYADPKSTQRDRDAADDALQKAKNAFTDAQNTSKEGGGSEKSSISASGISDLLGNVAKAAVQGQVESAFGVLGFKGEGALSQAIVQGVNYAEKNREQLQVAPRFSDEEIAKQGPVTPGTPGWLEKLIDSLKVPAVLRDSGGPLPHGMAALNLSGEEEWVLTGKQRRDYERDMAALRAGTGTGAAVAQLDSVAAQLQQLVDNPPIQHNSTFHGYDLQEAFRRDRVVKQQAAVAFRRR